MRTCHMVKGICIRALYRLLAHSGQPSLTKQCLSLREREEKSLVALIDLFERHMHRPGNQMGIRL